MSVELPPVPHLASLLEESGFLTPVWADFLNKLVLRSGGALGQTDDWKSVHTSAGYQKLPGGLILQWDVTASVNSATTLSETFSIAFPTACLHVIAGVKNNSAVATTATGHYGTGNYSTTGFDLYNRTSVANVFNWLAVGH